MKVDFALRKMPYKIIILIIMFFQALTIHAMLPPIYFIGVGLYLVLYFDIYRHAALEKAIYTVGARRSAIDY